MSAKVVVLAFDAMEPTFVERWAAEGWLPTFARVAATGTAVTLDTCMDTFPAAIWQELTTGRSAGTLGWYWQPHQVHAGEARQRSMQEGDCDLSAFWHHASAAGKRVAVVDIPYAFGSPGLNGVHLHEWGTHDHMGPPRSDPPAAMEEILARYGPHPLPHDPVARTRCDDHDGTERGFRQLREQLLTGAETRGRLLRDLLDAEAWDLFVGVFCEGHCAGHELWHLHDERSPWHDPTAPEDLRDALRRVYVQLDAALAHVLGGVGPADRVLVLCSHGLGPNRGGWQLLPEVLVRLGYGSGQSAASSVRGRLPDPVKRFLRAAVRGRARARLQAAAGSLPEPLESPRTRAMATMNGRCGAIRLNVRGRDPYGSIEPGAEYDDVCAQLSRELGELLDGATGLRAVAEVVRTDEIYGHGAHPNLPDLIVRWNQELNVIESLRSPRIGRVSRPVQNRALPRSGDHSTESRLWALGLGPPAGAEVPGMRGIDLAPTVLSLMGMDPPANLDGRPVELAAPATI